MCLVSENCEDCFVQFLFLFSFLTSRSMAFLWVYSVIYFQSIYCFYCQWLLLSRLSSQVWRGYFSINLSGCKIIKLALAITFVDDATYCKFRSICNPLNNPYRPITGAILFVNPCLWNRRPDYRTSCTLSLKGTRLLDKYCFVEPCDCRFSVTYSLELHFELYAHNLSG